MFLVFVCTPVVRKQYKRLIRRSVQIQLLCKYPSAYDEALPSYQSIKRKGVVARVGGAYAACIA